jgi:hypothetical protein
MDQKGVSFPLLNPYSLPLQENPSSKRYSQAHHEPTNEELEYSISNERASKKLNLQVGQPKSNATDTFKGLVSDDTPKHYPVPSALEKGSPTKGLKPVPNGMVGSFPH